MKILILANGYPKDGHRLGVFEYDQACALADAGHDVIFLALDMRSLRRWRKWGITKAQDEKMTVYRMNFPGGNLPLPLKAALGRFAFSVAMKRILKAEKNINLVHAHFIDKGVYAVRYCKEHKLPLVLTEHSSKINVEKIPASMQKWANEAYNGASCVLSVSHALADRIYAHTGVKAEVVPNIVDASVFHFTKREKSDVFSFVSTGNLIPIKGFDVLIKAFAQAFHDDETVRLTIIGTGADMNVLKELCTELGISDRVHFTGWQQREMLQSIYEKSDAFVLASRSETFGVAYIEAMLTGLPVIATKCGGPEDFVTSRNGILADKDDISGLAQALIDIRKRRDEYSDEGISQFAYESFSPEKISEKLTDIYESII